MDTIITDIEEVMKVIGAGLLAQGFKAGTWFDIYPYNGELKIVVRDTKNI